MNNLLLVAIESKTIDTKINPKNILIQVSSVSVPLG